MHVNPPRKTVSTVSSVRDDGSRSGSSGQPLPGPAVAACDDPLRPVQRPGGHFSGMAADDADGADANNAFPMAGLGAPEAGVAR